MQPFKFLKIDNHHIISTKLYEYIVNDTDVMTSDVTWNTLDHEKVLQSVPELKTVADNFNLEITMISAIKLTSTAMLHIDYSRDIRFLWPVANCQGSKTRFYDLNGSKINVVKNHGATFIEILNPELCTLSSELELTAPVVFNSAVPHKVFIDEQNTDTRLSVTVGFKTPPVKLFLVDT